MDRPIIQYISGGQRVDYDCETVTQDSLFWYYSYYNSLNNEIIKDITDTSRYGTGGRVKHCKKESSISGYVVICDSIKANREMSFNKTNRWLQDKEYDWYILPRIRIDSAYAAIS